MIVNVWNCRGMGRASKANQVKALFRDSKDDIIFLSELKIQRGKIESVLRFSGFRNYEIVPAIGIAGGVCLAWGDGIDVQIINANKNFITAVVKTSCGKSWHLIGVYIPAEKHKQQSVLDAIINTALACGGSYIAIRDFNNFVDNAEKSGGNDFAHSKSDHVEWIDSCELIDVGFSGNVFTWRNNSHDPSKRICVILDRGLTNAD